MSNETLNNFSNEIIEAISNKIINHTKNLYNQLVEDLSHQLSLDEIKAGFKKALTTEYSLKEIAFKY